ncbi:MAG: hypothetical protein CM15mP45_04510 [Deltaproteobacteria bacterium]|nr:MAG: hypothetical protein CM15mP45_04510 [Deltaproteobacteria bacterium]
MDMQLYWVFPNIYVTGRTGGFFDLRKRKSSKCKKATIWAMNNCEDIFLQNIIQVETQIWIEKIFFSYLKRKPQNYFD